jgi:MFS family permease
LSSEKLEGLRSRVLISCAIASFLTPFSSSSIAFLLPEISSHFGVEVALSNWSATAYLLALASSMVPFGRIADWKGRVKVFRAGLVIFTISSIATILVRDFGSFIALRVLHGLGSSMISATSVALISSIFREGRGKAIGINTAAVYIGLSLGPLSAGLLSDLISWISIFPLTGTLSGVSLLLSVNLPELGEGGSGPSYSSSLLFSASMICLIYGISNLDNILVLGFILMISWLLLELRRGGLIDPELLRNRSYMASSTAALLNYSATYAITIILSNYLHGFLSPSEAGLILTIQPVIQAALSPIAGQASDRRSPHLIASLGMILIALGIALLIPLGSEGLSRVEISLVILGAGFALFASPNTVAALNSSPPKLYGSATAFLGSMRFMGQAISSSIITALMMIEEPLQAMNSALVIYVAISISGAILSIIARFWRAQVI